MSVEPENESTIAVVFDFDDTIAPDSTTQLLEEYDINTESFWNDAFNAKVSNGYDPSIAALTEIREHIEDENLTAEALQEFGAEIEGTIYGGFRELIDDLNEIAEEYPGVSVEAYIISEGLREIIVGTDISDDFEAIYGSEFGEEGDGRVTGVKKTISFTDKTRYLFEINKGISQPDSDSNPYLVNDYVSKGERAIPFENIVYVGDGLTDIPCFSLVKDRGGRVFGVFDDSNPSEKQAAIRNIGSSHRTEGSRNVPAYTEEDRLGSLIRLTVESLCADRTIDSMEAIRM